MKTITVKATQGLKVPREDHSRRYIEAEPVIVPASAYYLRRIADGELVELTPAEAEAHAKKVAAEAKKTAEAEEKARAEAAKTPVKGQE